MNRMKHDGDFAQNPAKRLQARGPAVVASSHSIHFLCQLIGSFVSSHHDLLLRFRLDCVLVGLSVCLLMFM